MKIKSIKKLNKVEVYDIIDVEDNNNYIANGFIVHNSSEDWNKSENKELKKVLGQVRTKHLFYILCFPLKITKLDKSYLNSYVDYWIDLYDRGKGAIFIKDKGAGNDVWNIDFFKKIGSYNEFSSPGLVEKMLQNHPNFWQFITVPKVPKNVYGRYLEVRESNVYDDKNVIDAMSKEDFFRAGLILTLRDIIVRDGTLSIDRITKSISRVYKIDMSKNQLQAIISDAEQLAKKITERGDVNKG